MVTEAGVGLERASSEPRYWRGNIRKSPHDLEFVVTGLIKEKGLPLTIRESDGFGKPLPWLVDIFAPEGTIKVLNRITSSDEFRELKTINWPDLMSSVPRLESEIWDEETRRRALGRFCLLLSIQFQNLINNSPVGLHSHNLPFNIAVGIRLDGVDFLHRQSNRYIDRAKRLLHFVDKHNRLEPLVTSDIHNLLRQLVDREATAAAPSEVTRVLSS